jgi:hypothetical protein
LRIKRQDHNSQFAILNPQSVGIATAVRRPPGVQVWVEDIHHRLYAPEFHPSASVPREARIVGARNGTQAAGELRIADFELRIEKSGGAAMDAFSSSSSSNSQSSILNPQLVKPSLPASITRVLYGVPHPAWELRAQGERKSSGEEARPGFAEMAPVILDRYAQAAEFAALRREAQEAELKRIQFFDHLSAQAPASVPADSCQPVWLSVCVPESAAPGTYRAAVRITAKGTSAVELPLNLEVVDWRIPEPRDFKTIVALEQSPYGVARRYNVAPWSQEHFRLMQKSFALLARAGNCFLVVPVLCNTEFGNDTDSPVRVTRRKDGSLALDLAALDRYLDLAIKHCGKPRVVAFIVDHPGGTLNQPIGVYVKDEGEAKTVGVEIGPTAPPAQRRQVWQALAAGITAHMQARGLGPATHWGLHWDGVFDPTLPKLLKEFAPDVKWVRYSHRFGPDDTYDFCGTVRENNLLAAETKKGWKAPPDRVNLWTPRNWNGIACCYGTSAPFAYRMGLERALASGAPGVARMGVDYWDATWMHAFHWTGFAAGMTTVALFWPGEDGAETSARFEVFCEGLQEAETRIVLEQAMEKTDDAPLRQQISALLNQRHYDTLLAPVWAPHPKIEEYSSGWQVRSARLYQSAAEVTKRLGVDFSRSQLVADVPARGKAQVKATLRNWTSAARDWKLAADQDWIRPGAAEGKARPGLQEVAVTLDATRLEPDKPAKGKVTLTDAATGRREDLEITAQVGKVMQMTGQTHAANITVGQSQDVAFTLLNPSASELQWKVEAPVEWVRAQPAGGRLAAGAQVPLTLKVAPPDKDRARHEVDVRIRESGGTEIGQKLVVHVLPSYQPPAARPTATAVALETVHQDLVKSVVREGKDRTKEGVRFYRPDVEPYRYWIQDLGGLFIGQTKDAKNKTVGVKSYATGVGFAVPTDVTYRIEGKGFAAFAAEVGWCAKTGLREERRDKPRLVFEVYVDGRCAAHSGLMDPADAPRLLVVDGLRDAKEIRLLARLDSDQADSDVRAVWGDPVFYQGP